MRKVYRVLGALGGFAYPVLVWFALKTFGLSGAALCLIAVSALRWLGSRSSESLAVFGLGVLLAAISELLEASTALKLYPAVMNALFFLWFFSTLRSPLSAVERFALRSGARLTPAVKRYCRKVTQVWCVFFILNGSAAIVTAFWCTDRVWVLYNGLVSYVLIGLLFSGEWLYRTFRLKTEKRQ